MLLFNSLTKLKENIKPLEGETIRMYSCGPTVYDHAHIGNLSSFIFADTLKRTLKSAGFKVRHVMNFTDVDDKTIKRSKQKYPNLEPKQALHKLTREYEEIFKQDMAAIGNSIDDIEFVRATEMIPAMQVLISTLYEQGFAYIADDGVYFSIEAYKKSGKIYGQLLKINTENTSKARISNDEYAKDSVHDFALWKVAKQGEPTWQFHLDGQNLTGRPGWHIECSAMSSSQLGQPFDIHTGGVDLIFPHHENEIAQSTAGRNDPLYAKTFFHSEHLLVDGKKMSKSLDNFYTLAGIIKKGFNPLAFRLMILQSHYRNQSNFTWENLQSAQNRLQKWLAIADTSWQLKQNDHTLGNYCTQDIQNDINSPEALAKIDEYFENTHSAGLSPNNHSINIINNLIGINLSRHDITDEQKSLIIARKQARSKKDWNKSDQIRDELQNQGIVLQDIDDNSIWSRLL